MATRRSATTLSSVAVAGVLEQTSIIDIATKTEVEFNKEI